MLSQHDEPKRQRRDETLLLRPPRRLQHDTAGGVLSAGTGGLAVVPISQENSWFWMLGEVEVNWWDLSRGQRILMHAGAWAGTPTEVVFLSCTI